MDNEGWAYPHLGDLPNNNRAVSVLVIHKDGTYTPDIGRYYGKAGGGGWNLQLYGSNGVVAWSNLPTFVDHVELIEHDYDD